MQNNERERELRAVHAARSPSPQLEEEFPMHMPGSGHLLSEPETTSDISIDSSVNPPVTVALPDE